MWIEAHLFGITEGNPTLSADTSNVAPRTRGFYFEVSKLSLLEFANAKIENRQVTFDVDDGSYRDHESRLGVTN